ncbi:MAG: hypothetical protein WCH83_09395 [Alphaproteobacteria bacterium]
MEKKIKQQQQKMAFVMLLIFAMTAWQFKFIYDGVMANVYMNGTIIAAFLASCALSFVSIGKLKNEVTALHALKEMWADVRSNAKNSTSDPFWRHYRALKPGIVFDHPKILGHAYDLVVDEIARTKTLRLGVETMATLVHKIEQKLADEKSFLAYMSGLLVFMGLIGAFIGLLKMVGSIGGIIGGLEGAASGGGDGFGKLLGDLQKPLSGMATGFASSLFGLFGSLVVGLLGRFNAEAAQEIKNEFESWLASVAQIEADPQHAGSGESSHGTVKGGLVSAEGRAIAQQIAVTLDPLISRTMNTMATKTQLALDRTTESIRSLAEGQATHSEAVRSTAEKLAIVVANQSDVQNHLSRVTSMGNSLSELKVEMERMAATFEKRVATSFEPMTRLVETALRSQFETLERLSAQQTELTIAVTRLVEITPAETQGMVGEKLEQGVHQGFTKVAQVLDNTMRATAHGLHQIAQQQQAVNALVAKMSVASGLGDDRNQILRVTEGLERSISAGFIEMSRSFETTFGAYAELVRTTNAAQNDASRTNDMQAFEHDAAADDAVDIGEITPAMANRLYEMARQTRGAA